MPGIPTRLEFVTNRPGTDAVMGVVGKHGFTTTASLRSTTVTAKSAEPVLRLCPDLGTTSGHTRDTNPCSRELDFGTD